MTKLSWFGVIATIIYGLCIAAVVHSSWAKFEILDPNEWGDFFAGTLGPLAIFWLILGYFQQGAELRHSVEALKLQAAELKNSVEQQKAMVGVTEKQLQLDVEVREEQNLLLRSKELPLLQLQAAGNSGSGGSSKGRRYQFTITNIGADAQSIRGNLDHDRLDLRGSNRAFTARGTEYKFTIHTIDAPEFPQGVDHKLTLISSNVRGQERTQVFEVGNSEPNEIVCDPPRG